MQVTVNCVLVLCIVSLTYATSLNIWFCVFSFFFFFFFVTNEGNQKIFAYDLGGPFYLFLGNL